MIDVEEVARRYEVFDLTDDEMADHVARHESVVLFAGTFDDCSWDSEAGVYRHGELRRGVDWSSYVDPFPTPENQAYEGRKPIGWFVEQHIQLGPSSP